MQTRRIGLQSVAGCLFLCLALLLLAFGQPTRASATLIQTATDATNNAGTSVTATFDSNPAAGNLLVAICGGRDSVSISGPNSFSTAISQTGTPSQAIFYKVAAGNETSLTCTSGSTRLGIHAYEFSGVETASPLEATGSSNGNGTGAASGSVTTTSDETLLIVGVTLNANTNFSAWSNSFTGHNSFQSGGAAGSRSAYGGASRSVTSVGTYSTTASVGSSAAWRGQIAAFKLTEEEAVLAADIVDGSGNPVAGPSISMNAVDASMDCQTSAGTLGSGSQRIRIDNTTANGNWTVALAATGGSSATWSNGTHTYAYNDPAGTPSGCASGQLSVDPDAGVVAPGGSCGSSGISKGAATAFSQGMVDTVTLLSASGSQTGCWFDLTGVGLLQTIPGETPASFAPYTIDMTITVVAN